MRDGIYRRFICVHHTSEPSPLPRDARSPVLPSRDRLRPFGMGYIVRMASDKTVTSPARTPRLLPEERQVYQDMYLINNQLHDITSHGLDASGTKKGDFPAALGRNACTRQDFSASTSKAPK
jgi:hypothetical protein